METNYQVIHDFTTIGSFWALVDHSSFVWPGHDTQVHRDVYSGAVPAVVCLQIWTGRVDEDQPDAILASHIKSTAYWPNIQWESDKVYLVLSFESMAKWQAAGKCSKSCIYLLQIDGTEWSCMPSGIVERGFKLIVSLDNLRLHQNLNYQV